MIPWWYWVLAWVSTGFITWIGRAIPARNYRDFGTFFLMLVFFPFEWIFLTADAWRTIRTKSSEHWKYTFGDEHDREYILLARSIRERKHKLEQIEAMAEKVKRVQSLLKEEQLVEGQITDAYNSIEKLFKQAGELRTAAIRAIYPYKEEYNVTLSSSDLGSDQAGDSDRPQVHSTEVH